MEKRMVKIVVVKHPNCGVPYVFQVPWNAELEAGDLVYMDTSKGKDQVATCITPSFYVDEELRKWAYGPNKLRMVKGELIKYEYKDDGTADFSIGDKPFDAR